MSLDNVLPMSLDNSVTHVPERFDCQWMEFIRVAICRRKHWGIEM
jgi:hypothetical protein